MLQYITVATNLILFAFWMFVSVKGTEYNLLLHIRNMYHMTKVYKQEIAVMDVYRKYKGEIIYFDRN